MTYELHYALALGSANAGKTLVAKLFGTNGDQVGEDITTGFVEQGGGFYQFQTWLPDGFRGVVMFYDRDALIYGPLAFYEGGVGVFDNALNLLGIYSLEGGGTYRCLVARPDGLFMAGCYEGAVEVYDSQGGYQETLLGGGLSDGRLSDNSDSKMRLAFHLLTGSSILFQHVLDVGSDCDRLLSFTDNAGGGAATLPSSGCADIACYRNAWTFVLDAANYQIHRYDNNSSYSGSFGEYGEGAGKFLGPTCLAVIDNGQLLLVGDKSGGAISFWEFDGDPTATSIADEEPDCMAVYEVGIEAWLCVANAGAGELHLYHNVGGWHLESTLALPEGLSQASSVRITKAFTGDFTYFVADDGAKVVWVYSGEWWSIDSVDGEPLTAPSGVELAGTTLYIAQYATHRIGAFSVDVLGQTASLTASFGAPFRYAFTSIADMAVSECMPSSVYVLDAFVGNGGRVVVMQDPFVDQMGDWITTNEVGAAVGASEADGEFYNLFNGVIAAAPDGTFYVLDTVSTADSRIQRFSAEGAFQTSWMSRERASELAVAPNGNVYAVSSGCVEVFDPDGVLLETLTPDPLLASLVFDDDGTAYALCWHGELLDFCRLDSDLEVVATSDYYSLSPAPVWTPDVLADTPVAICAVNPEEAEYLDVAISTRAQAGDAMTLTEDYDAAKTAAQAGDAMTLTSGERSTLVAAVWNALTSGLTTLGSIGKRLVDLITGTANTDSLEAIRDKLDTLPVTASQLAEVGNAGVFIATAYTRWTQSIALDRALTATWAKCYVSIKVSDGDTDEHAILRLQVTNPGDAAQDGIVRLNKTAGGDNRTKGTLTVAGDRATVTVELDDEIMAVLSEGTYTLDVKEIGAGSGESYRCAFGTVEIGLTTTRATA
jgi:WD40 repeat protein